MASARCAACFPWTPPLAGHCHALADWRHGCRALARQSRPCARCSPAPTSFIRSLKRRRPVVHQRKQLQFVPLELAAKTAPWPSHHLRIRKDYVLAVKRVPSPYLFAFDPLSKRVATDQHTQDPAIGGETDAVRAKFRFLFVRVVR